MTGPLPGHGADRQLVIAFQQGNPGAYDDIYRRFLPRVRWVCRRVLANEQDVQEAIQETFLSAYEALGRLNGRYALGAWLSRIALNICLDYVRISGRRPQLVPLAREHEAVQLESGPEDGIAGSNPRLEDVIQGIYPLHAEALKLRALKGYSHDEMAARFGMSSAQVKALLHRARTSFKSAWNRPEDVFGYEFLTALGDAGVLQTFLRLPEEDQAHFVSLIGATEAKTRRHRTETFVSVLKMSPMNASEHATRVLSEAQSEVG